MNTIGTLCSIVNPVYVGDSRKMGTFFFFIYEDKHEYVNKLNYNKVLGLTWRYRITCYVKISNSMLLNSTKKIFFFLFWDEYCISSFEDNPPLPFFIHLVSNMLFWHILWILQPPRSFGSLQTELRLLQLNFSFSGFSPINIWNIDSNAMELF